MTIQELKHAIVNWRLTRVRVINLSIGVAAVLIYEFIARPVYRPYIYQNNINDFHLADTIGNTLGTIATIFIFLGLIGEGKKQHLFLIKTITMAVTLFELSHPLLGKLIDTWDLIATFVTGFLCFMLYKIIHPAEAAE